MNDKTEIKTNIVTFSVTDAALTELKDNLKDIDATAGPKAYAEAKTAARGCQKLRSALTADHKEQKADALAFGRRLDAEKNRVLGLITEIEDPIREGIAAVDNEAARVEEARVGIIQIRINAMESLGLELDDLSLDDLRKRHTAVIAFKIDDSYEEFAEEAESEKSTALSRLARAIRAKEDKAAEEARLEKRRKEQAEEDERLEKRRQEQADEDKRLERKRKKMEAGERERQRKIDERQEVEQKRIDDEAKELREKQERLNKEEEDRLAEAERKLREKAEAEEAERVAEEKRQHDEAMKPDADKLRDYADRLKTLPQPQLESASARDVLDVAEDELDSIADAIQRSAGEL